MIEPEFKGYWSDKDKEIWESTDWKARDYDELPVGEEIVRDAYFYSMNEKTIIKPIIFVKYIRSNPIYPPYYGPVKTKELLDFIIGKYVGAMYNGNKEGPYDIHDRFETADLYNHMSI